MISFAVSLLPLVEDDAVMGLVEGGKHDPQGEYLYFLLLTLLSITEVPKNERSSC